MKNTFARPTWSCESNTTTSEHTMGIHEFISIQANHMIALYYNNNNNIETQLQMQAECVHCKYTNVLSPLKTALIINCSRCDGHFDKI